MVHLISVENDDNYLFFASHGLDNSEDISSIMVKPDTFIVNKEVVTIDKLRSNMKDWNESVEIVIDREVKSQRLINVFTLCNEYNVESLLLKIR